MGLALKGLKFRCFWGELGLNWRSKKAIFIEINLQFPISFIQILKCIKCKYRKLNSAETFFLCKKINIENGFFKFAQIRLFCLKCSKFRIYILLTSCNNTLFITWVLEIKNLVGLHWNQENWIEIWYSRYFLSPFAKPFIFFTYQSHGF